MRFIVFDVTAGQETTSVSEGLKRSVILDSRYYRVIDLSPLYISVIFKHQSCPVIKIMNNLFHLRAGTKIAANLILNEVCQAGSEVVLGVLLAGGAGSV